MRNYDGPGGYLGFGEDKTMSMETEDRRSTQTPNRLPVVGSQLSDKISETDNRQLTTDNSLDRSDEFDQTRQHAHIPASLCPVADCKEWPTVAEYGASPTQIDYQCKATTFGVRCLREMGHVGPCTRRQHVSPAINEFRIQQLEEENRVLRERIAGFERMNERLSNAVDEWLANATAEHKAAA